MIKLIIFDLDGVLVEAKNSDEMDTFLDELLIKINGYLN